MKKPFYLKKVKRKSGVVYLYKLNKESGVVSRDETIFHSTGQSSKAKAEVYVLKIIEEKKKQRIAINLTLREYAEPFYLWDKCPHIRRLLDENKSITKRYANIQRQTLEKYIFKDQIADMMISDIRRADVLDFRSRLLKRTGERTVNRVIGILKLIFKEGIYREELDRDPTVGIGEIKYQKKITGIFSVDELKRLFPENSFGPWAGLLDYACFLLAATTGMRRGEILGLHWRNVDLDNGIIHIVEAWKGGDEIGEPKWNQKRVAPLPERTIQVLSQLREDSIRTNPDDYVFCYDDGQRLGETWWKKHFQNAMKKAGIETRARNLKPHSFRHTLNTLLRDAGQDPAKIRATLGWRQERTQDGYTHWQAEHLRQQADIIDGVF